MSGSGGGGFSSSRGGGYGSGSGSGGGSSTPQVSCEKLVITTQLASPKEEVIEGINKGDVLTVAIREITGRSMIVVLHEDAIAGGLADPSLHRLRECLEKGTEYEAVVLSKEDGQVRVRVQARP